MDNSLKYLGSLIGRVFLITHSCSLKGWGGNKENDDKVTDYDLLDDIISYEEGDLTQFKNPLNMIYYIFFSMSSKIEIFKKENGFVLCDGLYFNKSWDYLNTTFETIEDMNVSIEINDDAIVIFDASFSGNDIVLNGKDGVYKILNNNINSYSVINLINGIYAIKKVEAHILFNEEDITVKGIEFSGHVLPPAQRRIKQRSGSAKVCPEVKGRIQ